MKMSTVRTLFDALLKAIPLNVAKQAVGAGLRHIKESFQDSSNKIDDALIPVVDLALNILGEKDD